MKKSVLVITCCIACCLVRAQNSLYISPGTNLFISAGTTVSVDSLVLMPSAGFNIAGGNSLTRSTTILHPSFNAHIHRVFQWNTTLPSFTGDIIIYYRDDELNGLAENTLTLNIHDGTEWDDISANVTRDGTNNFVLTASFVNMPLNELTLASLAAPLPLRWLKVEAIRVNNNTLVKWRTANETNCKDYQVQKSIDGRNWENVGSNVVANNLPGPNDYQLIDATAITTLTYYRIQQSDIDGKISYSIIVSVQADNKEAVVLFPNPVTDKLNIVAKGGIQLQGVQVYNAAGLLIAAENLNNVRFYTLFFNRLAGGSYTIRIRLSDGTFISHTIIKQ